MQSPYISNVDYTVLMNEIFLVVSAFIAVFALVFFAIYLSGYILNGIAYTKLSKKRGRKHVYLAWIPFARYYLFGKVADEIDNDYGKRKGRGVTLFVLSILTTIGVVVGLLLLLPICISLLGSLQPLMQYAMMGYDDLIEPFIATIVTKYTIPVLVGGFIFILTAAFAIWKLIVNILSWYRVFKEYAGSRITIYTLLSTIFTILLGLDFIAPIFILSCYKNTPNKVLSNQYNGFTANPYGQAAPSPSINPSSEPMPNDVTASSQSSIDAPAFETEQQNHDDSSPVQDEQNLQTPTEE